MNKALVWVLAILLLTDLPAWAGIPSDSSMFVGGTVSSIPAKTIGKISTTDEKVASSQWKGGNWQVSYDKVTGLAYGQHAGRRVGATIAWGAATLGILALPMLFSKKRHHYLTIEYADEAGKPQAAIFEIGKNAVRTTLKIIEVRTGKKIEYEDEEARKAGTK